MAEGENCTYGPTLYYYSSKQYLIKKPWTSAFRYWKAVVYQMWKYLAKVKGFHYWPPKFNSKDSAFVFFLELFVLFLSLKQEMDNNF